MFAILNTSKQQPENVMRKTLSVKINKRGIKYALAQDGETFSVWKLCENYAPHCKGGMSQTWRYIEKGIPREAADTLFNRRSA